MIDLRRAKMDRNMAACIWYDIGENSIDCHIDATRGGIRIKTAELGAAID